MVGCEKLCPTFLKQAPLILETGLGGLNGYKEVALAEFVWNKFVFFQDDPLSLVLRPADSHIVVMSSVRMMSLFILLITQLV